MDSLYDDDPKDWSPGGLSMSCWVDSYINVLLKKALVDIKVSGSILERTALSEKHEDQAARDCSRPLTEDEAVLKFVEKIISHSVGVVLCQEQEFVNDLILGILNKVSQQVMAGDGFDIYQHNMNVFAREFTNGVIETTIRECGKAAENDRNTKVIPRGESESTPHMTGGRKERKQSHCKKVRSSGVPGGIKENVETLIGTDVTSLGMDYMYMYVHHRLMAILGQGLDTSIIRFVMGAVSEHGSWDEQFKAVEENIGAVEKKLKDGHPLLIDLREKSDDTIRKEEAEADVQCEAKHLNAEVNTNKMAEVKISVPSRARRILMRVRRSLMNFKISSKK